MTVVKSYGKTCACKQPEEHEQMPANLRPERTYTGSQSSQQPQLTATGEAWEQD